MFKNIFFIKVFLCLNILNLNAAEPVSIFATLGISFGPGGPVTAFFGPVTFTGGLVIGGAMAIMSSRDRRKIENSAQAPGLPSKEDGFIPSKNWDGKKRRHPLNGKVGYPDKKGNIWVPTGPGPLAHGGPHWDVQLPDGKSKNIYPGGKVR